MRGFLMVMLLVTGSVSAQGQSPKITGGWVELPSGGEASASAFAVIQNPTMYDVYLVSAASEVAGKVELREGDSDERKEPVIPAYGKLTMKPDGTHIVLMDLKRPLEEGESIPMTITTDSSLKLRFKAVVRKE
jgi:copper(I)-binding protein